MAYLTLEWDEVQPLIPNVDEARGRILLEDVLARAVGIVPELAGDLTEAQVGVAKAVVRKAVARWADSGTGGVTTKAQSAGPFQQTETYEARGDRPLLYDSEINELKGLFDSYSQTKGKAFSIDLVPPRATRSIFDMGW